MMFDWLRRLSWGQKAILSLISTFLLLFLESTFLWMGPNTHYWKLPFKFLILDVPLVIFSSTICIHALDNLRKIESNIIKANFIILIVLNALSVILIFLAILLYLFLSTAEGTFT